MNVEIIKNDAHEQMSEVVLGMLGMFNTTDISEIGPFTPVLMAIMGLPRPQRKSIGLELVKSFYREHAINIENAAERSVAVRYNTMIIWSIEHATTMTRRSDNTDAPIGAGLVAV